MKNESRSMTALLALIDLSEKATGGLWGWSLNGNIVTDTPKPGCDWEIAAVYTDRDDDLEPANAAFISTLVNWFRSQDWRAANARAEGWLPIESAPKDGTVVVMGYGEYRERDGFSPAFMRWYPMAEGWFVNAMPFYPTHWQPLPESPAAQAVQGETK